MIGRVIGDGERAPAFCNQQSLRREAAPTARRGASRGRCYDAPSMKPLAWVIGLSLLGSAAFQAAPRPSTTTGEWPTYGGDLASSKYSPLDQLTPDNFGSLKVAWRTPSPDGVLTIATADGGEWSAPAPEVFAELSRTDPKRWRDNQPPIVGNF